MSTHSNIEHGTPMLTMSHFLKFLSKIYNIQSKKQKFHHKTQISRIGSSRSQQRPTVNCHISLFHKKMPYLSQKAQFSCHNVSNPNIQVTMLKAISLNWTAYVNSNDLPWLGHESTSWLCKEDDYLACQMYNASLYKRQWIAYKRSLTQHDR